MTPTFPFLDKLRSGFYLQLSYGPFGATTFISLYEMIQFSFLLIIQALALGFPDFIEEACYKHFTADVFMGF